jgi:hypothetical protein
MVALVMLIAASGVIKNGKALIESESTAAVVETPALPSAPAPVVTAIPASTAQPSEKLPFVGRQSFNFDGGNGTGLAITPLDNGHVRVETIGTTGSSVDYEGPFTNPLRISKESGLLFKDNMVFMTDGRLSRQVARRRDRTALQNYSLRKRLAYPSNELTCRACRQQCDHLAIQRVRKPVRRRGPAKYLFWSPTEIRGTERLTQSNPSTS